MYPLIVRGILLSPLSMSRTTWTWPVQLCFKAKCAQDGDKVGRLRALIQGVVLRALPGCSSLLVGDFPESFAVASAPSDLQQDLGLGVRIENALAAGILGRKGSGQVQ